MTYVKERPAATKNGNLDDHFHDSYAKDINGDQAGAVDESSSGDRHNTIASDAPEETQDQSPEKAQEESPDELEALSIHCSIQEALTFYPVNAGPIEEEPSDPLSLMVVEAILIPDDTLILDFRLRLQVPFDTYQELLRRQWFNLIPAILHSNHDQDFDPEKDLVLEIGLKSDFLEHLTILGANNDNSENGASSELASDAVPIKGVNPDLIIQRLVALNQVMPDLGTPDPVTPNPVTPSPSGNPTENQNADISSPLFHADNWLCCSVKQTLEKEDVGYTTLWSYLLMHPLANPGSDGLHIDSADTAGVFTNLFKNAAVTFQSEFEKQLPQLQSNWVEFLDGLKEMVDEVVQELGEENATDSRVNDSDQDEPLGTRRDARGGLGKEASAYPGLMDNVVKPFFDSEDWSFVQLDEATLQLAFQGEHGRWSCLAESSDESQQFIFYSLYPFPVEPEDQASVLEFLMRANSGMIIGNFELDFTTGDVRFKTSVDVEGIRFKLSTCYSVYQQLWHQLAYINVITMDRYFPGITAIVNHTLTPEEAIAQVEANLASDPSNEFSDSVELSDSNPADMSPTG